MSTNIPRSSSLPRPYIGSRRNRHYIYNKLPSSSSSLLSNDCFFSSKSFLPNQSKQRIYLSSEVPSDTLRERVDKEFISSLPTPLGDRQLYQGRKTRDFLSSSSSSSLFLLPTTQNKISRTSYDPLPSSSSSSTFAREQQKIAHNHHYERPYSYCQSSTSGNINNHSPLLSEHSSKRNSFSIDNYHIDRNNATEDKSSLLSLRLVNDSIVVNKDNHHQLHSLPSTSILPSFPSHHSKISDTNFSSLSSNKTNDSKTLSKISNNTFERPSSSSSSFRFSTDRPYRSDAWELDKMSSVRHSSALDTATVPKTHSYDQRISDQGNKYIIQLTTDDFEENEFTIVPYYSRSQLVIDAKHIEEDSLGGFIRRELHKIFPIPKQFDLNKRTYSYNKKTQELIVEMPCIQSITNENRNESSFVSSTRDPNQSYTFSYGDLGLAREGNLSSTVHPRSDHRNTTIGITDNPDISRIDARTKPFDFDSFHRSAFRPQIISGTSNDNTHEKKLLMSLDLTDYQPEDIQVSIKDQELIVKAERKVETDTRKSRTSFFQSTSLPPQTDIERLQSNYVDGKLVIEAPYLERHVKANNHAETNRDTVIKSEQKSVEEDPYQQRTETVIEFIRRRRV